MKHVSDIRRPDTSSKVQQGAVEEGMWEHCSRDVVARLGARISNGAAVLIWIDLRLG